MFLLGTALGRHFQADSIPLNTVLTPSQIAVLAHPVLIAVVAQRVHHIVQVEHTVFASVDKFLRVAKPAMLVGFVLNQD